MNMLDLINSDITTAPPIPESKWTDAKKDHEKKMAAVIEPYLDKRSRQMKDPVMDFLFEYYAFRPSNLMRWSPGIGVEIEIGDSSQLPEISELRVDDEIARLDPALFPKKRIQSLKWILEMLEKSRGKKPFFGCFGMHEWAMVYRAENVRHQQIPLRLTGEEIAKFVESRPLLCTHFDAYRFFTDEARPLNRHPLKRETMQDMEQPGCVHTNMDLYKWAFKLYPWMSSEVIREAFFNAIAARKIDMQASPYDATEFGLEPIKIETEEGRKEYMERQMEIYKNSEPVRENVIEGYERILRILD